MLSNPLLLLVAAPVMAGFICLFMPDRMRAVTKLISLVITAASLALSIYVFIKKPVSWDYGAPAFLLADGLSAFVGMAVSLFAFLITIYSFGFTEKSIGRYFGYVLITLGVSSGAVFADNLIAILFFWGISGALLYLLVSMRDTDRAAASAKKAFIIIGGTDAVMIFGVGLIWLITGTFSMDKIHLPLNAPLPVIAFISLAVASFAKAGAMPFHSWLPDVAEDGPTSVTAYLPASLDKLLGIYLLARISLKLFIANDVSNTILSFFGAVTIVLAVIFAVVQHDVKRLLGYHAVSQVGYMVLGLGTGNPIGIAGGLFHMVNNAIYKSCLFLGAGSVEKKTGTSDLSKLGALAKYMPVTFVCFLIASLSISGIPPFNGFVSKWMIYQGIIESAGPKNPLWIAWLVCAMLGSALTLASFMKLLHAVFLGRPSRDFKEVREAGFSMSFPVIILASLCFIFGVFAFKLPIPLFIMPSIGSGIVYLGLWSPIIATILIMVGIAAGLLIYLMFRPGRLRTSETFVGGEKADDLPRVSGAEFYDTLRDIRGLNTLYNKEETKSFDIYEGGSRVTFYFSGLLKWLHNGILPTYLVWCLIGMLVLFFAMIK